MTFGEFLNSNWKWFIPTTYILLHIIINFISFKIYDFFENKTPQKDSNTQPPDNSVEMFYDTNKMEELKNG